MVHPAQGRPRPGGNGSLTVRVDLSDGSPHWNSTHASAGQLHRYLVRRRLRRDDFLVPLCAASLCAHDPVLTAVAETRALLLNVPLGLPKGRLCGEDDSIVDRPGNAAVLPRGADSPAEVPLALGSVVSRRTTRRLIRVRPSIIAARNRSLNRQEPSNCGQAVQRFWLTRKERRIEPVAHSRLCPFGAR